MGFPKFWCQITPLAELQEFTTKNGIRHITLAPYHPATDGLVERAVQTLKKALKKQNNGDIETRLVRFLFHYRNTPHTTGVSPAELLLRRKPWTHHNLFQLNISSRAQYRQTKSKNTTARDKTFRKNDLVYAENLQKQGKSVYRKQS